MYEPQFIRYRLDKVEREWWIFSAVFVVLRKVVNFVPEDVPLDSLPEDVPLDCPEPEEGDESEDFGLLDLDAPFVDDVTLPFAFCLFMSFLFVCRRVGRWALNSDVLYIPEDFKMWVTVWWLYALATPEPEEGALIWFAAVFYFVCSLVVS